MTAFLLAAAFQCSNPIWQLRSGKCFNQWAFWIVFGIFDIVSDVYSISVVMSVSSNLHLQTSSKVSLLITLSSKFRPVICAAARLPFIKPAYTSANYTIELYKLGMPTQLQLHLSVVALSLGKIIRFLNLLDEGYLTSAIAPTSGKGTKNRKKAGYGKGGVGISGSSSSSSSSSKGTGKRSRGGAKAFIMGSHASSRHKSSGSDDHGSSKNLVPDTYGKTTTKVQAVPLSYMPDSRRTMVEVTSGSHHHHHHPHHADELEGHPASIQANQNPFTITVTRDLEVKTEDRPV